MSCNHATKPVSSPGFSGGERRLAGLKTRFLYRVNGGFAQRSRRGSIAVYENSAVITRQRCVEGYLD